MFGCANDGEAVSKTVAEQGGGRRVAKARSLLLVAVALASLTLGVAWTRWAFADEKLMSPVLIKIINTGTMTRAKGVAEQKQEWARTVSGCIVSRCYEVSTLNGT